MFKIGLVIFLIGIVCYVMIYIKCQIWWLLPAVLSVIIGIIVMNYSISNKNISNIYTTQNTNQIQEQEDVNNYNYCPTCGNKIKEE